MNTRSFSRLRQDLCWQLRPPEYGISPEEGIAGDELLLRLNADYGVIRIWQSTQSLVATTKESYMPNFAAACRRLAEEGWPVHIRRTGGSCVPQGLGILNLAMAYPTPDVWNLDESYEFLGFPLQQLCRSLGFTPEFGSVAGSFCDGRYNMQIAGQKIVGTAQRWRRNSLSGQGYVLAHACILVEVDLPAATEKINALYAQCQQATRFRSDACISLARLLGTPPTVNRPLLNEISLQLIRILKNEFNLLSINP